MVEIGHGDMEYIARVHYYLNDNHIGSTDTSPFPIHIMPDGEESLVVRAVAETPFGSREAFTVIAPNGSSLLTTNNE